MVKGKPRERGGNEKPETRADGKKNDGETPGVGRPEYPGAPITPPVIEPEPDTGSPKAG
jgi:hypothetical protein